MSLRVLRRPVWRVGWLHGIAAWGILNPFPTSAEQPNDSQNEPIAPLVIEITSVTRRETNAQDTPLNFALVSSEEVEQHRLHDLADLSPLIPGLSYIDQGGRDANLLIARGLNIDSMAASEIVGTDGDGTVAHYLGDVPVFSDLQMLDLERVEVQLGPQGTLFGAGTLAGAIRYLPKKPVLGQRSLSLSQGAFGIAHSDDLGFESQIIGNLPVTETTALRAAVRYDHQPGYIDNPFLVREPGVSNPEPDFRNAAEVTRNLRLNRDANFERTLASRLALRQRFSDTSEATFSYQQQHKHSGGRSVNHREAFGTGIYESATRFPEPNTRDNHLLALEITHHFTAAELTSATGFSLYEQDGHRDQTDLLLNFEFGYEDFPHFVSFTRDTTKDQRLTQELRLVSTAQWPMNWLVGAYLSTLKHDETNRELTPGLPQFFGVDRPDNMEYLQITDSRNREHALFGELVYGITPAWSVTGGLRYYQFDDRQRVGIALPLDDGSAPSGIIPIFDEAESSNHGTVFKLNTAYRFNPNLLTYATLSQGYRNGGANPVALCASPLPTSGAVACALPSERTFKPDSTLNHEIGLRGLAWEGRAQLNASVFYILWDDAQVSGATVNGGVPITVNAQAARSQGADFTLNYHANPHWSFATSYTYTDAKLTAYAPGVVNGQDAFAGDRLPGSPQHRGYVLAGYRQPLSPQVALETQYRISAQSNVYTTPGLRNGGEALKPYATHHSSIGLIAPAWTLRLYAQNLLNEYAETGVRANPSFIRSIDGDADGDGTTDHAFRLRRYQKSVIEPLRVGLVFDYRFGL